MQWYESPVIGWMEISQHFGQKSDEIYFQYPAYNENVMNLSIW